MLSLSCCIDACYRPVSTLLKPACSWVTSVISVICLIATVGLAGCDNRTHSDSDVKVPSVQIEQTAPLVAGSSVGSANISLDSTPTDAADSTSTTNRIERVDNAMTDDAITDNVITDKATIPKATTDKAAGKASNNVTNQTNNAANNAANTKDIAASPIVLTDLPNPAAFKLSKNQPSMVSSKVSAIKEGTPEATLKNAINTLYYGDAHKAAGYYKTDIPDFAQQLVNTQQGFKQNVQKITLTEVIYNQDKSQAVIKGSLTIAGKSQPDSAEFRLRKVNGEWKILG